MLTISGLVYNFLNRLSTTVSAKIGKPTIVFVLGAPGAGKGTQCTNLVKDYNFEHLSAGDLLRAERNSGSIDGDLIQRCISEGEIVPVEITIKLIEKAMNKSSKEKFLIDGFPRNKNNLDGWNNMMTGKANVMGVLYFECPEDTCVKRILKRGETSGRIDDNEESLRKRFKTYYNDTMPVIEYFRKIDLVMTVSGVPGPDEVYGSVRAHMDKRL